VEDITKVNNKNVLQRAIDKFIPIIVER